jgi:hypothetical protein
MDTSQLGVTRIGGAEVAVVTVRGRLSGTNPAYTRVVTGADVAVVAQAGPRCVDTAGRATAVRRADIVVLTT